ncbi:MAG: hypothetical protein HYS38_07735 [Acidobacteria bacterium]|nr:hypothetical protein [Acidobacteriota bacterium]
MRKQYTALPLRTPDPGLQGQDKTWEPLLRIRVSYKHQLTPWILAVVDSGAPYCLFRADVADFLHIDLKKGPEGEMGGIIGGPREPLYFHRVSLIIEGNWTIDVLGGFMKKLSVPAILGRCGFFERFYVNFDHSKNPPEVEITRIETIN